MINLEAEYNLLNVLFQYQEKQSFIFENCAPEFFSDSLNRKIFATAKELYQNGEDVDNVVIYEKLKRPNVNKRLIDILTNYLGLTPLVKQYCSILYKNRLNQLIENAKTDDDFKYIEDFKNKYALNDIKIKHISDGVENFESNYNKKQNLMLITGYNELDKCIGSFCGGDYIALGGSTGTGKTTLALNLAKQLCCQGKSVLYCSLEMPLEQLQNRFNCMTMGLNALKFRSCGFTKEELARYKSGLNTLNEWNLYILCDYNLTVEKLRAYINEQQKDGLDFVIIDYLGLMSGYGNKSLYEKSTIISRKIKILATDLNIPILVLVQLNRDLKNRQDKRPVLSDIRESGAIEQDADFVLFAHRPYIYNHDSRYKNDLEVIIAKNRHGTSNVSCHLNFNLETQDISSKERYIDIYGGKYD